MCITHSARAKNAVGQRHNNCGLKWERAIGQRMFKGRCSKKTKWTWKDMHDSSV